MSPQPTHVAKLQNLDDRLARLRAERGRLVARASHAARTLDTRQKILVGAAVLTALELGSDVPAFSSFADLTRWLDGRLTRPHDRAVFDLPMPAQGQGPAR
jgi:hypothetical protein